MYMPLNTHMKWLDRDIDHDCDFRFLLTRVNFLMPLQQVLLNKTHITLTALKRLFSCKERDNHEGGEKAKAFHFHGFSVGVQVFVLPV